MVDGLVDAAEAALEVADLVGDLVETDRKRKRWKGCLVLLVLIAAIALLTMLLVD